MKPSPIHALFLFAFLTFVIGDVLTTMIGVKTQGIQSESNPIVADIIQKDGYTGYLTWKIIGFLIITIITIILYAINKTVGFTALFIVGMWGTFLTLSNIVFNSKFGVPITSL